MGNTVSKALDTGLRIACVATGGLIGKSSEGYHFGPLRLKKDSIGVNLNVGICNLGLKIGKNEFGKLSLEGQVTCGIPEVASGTIKAGIENDGCYGGLSGQLNVGPAKANIGVVADTKGNIRSFDCGATGPLLTNVQYSKSNGLSGGIFGLSVDKNKNVDYSLLKDCLINKAGEHVRASYESSKKEKEDRNGNKDEKENKNIPTAGVRFRRYQRENKGVPDQGDTEKNKHEMAEPITKLKRSEQDSSQRTVTMNKINRRDQESIQTLPLNGRKGNKERKDVIRNEKLIRAEILQANKQVYLRTPETIPKRKRLVSNVWNEFPYITQVEKGNESKKRTNIQLRTYKKISKDKIPNAQITPSEILQVDRKEEIVREIPPKEQNRAKNIPYCSVCGGPCKYNC